MNNPRLGAAEATRHYVLQMFRELGVEYRVDVPSGPGWKDFGDNLVEDWHSVPLNRHRDGGVAELGDDFNPSVLVGLAEDAVQWALGL